MPTDSLGRVSLVEVAVAVVLTVTVVLPAEYGVDPTGIGRRIGLTQMGRLKVELAKEAGMDGLRYPAEDSVYEEPLLRAAGLVP